MRQSAAAATSLTMLHVVTQPKYTWWGAPVHAQGVCLRGHWRTGPRIVPAATQLLSGLLASWAPLRVFSTHKRAKDARSADRSYRCSAQAWLLSR
jgi:hypothetical protein